MKNLEGRGRRTARNTLTYGRVISKIHERAKACGFVVERGPHAGKVNIAKLNRISGISTATLWYMIRRPETYLSFDVHTLAKLCFALDCQPGDLFRYERIAGALRPGEVVIGRDPTDIDDLPGTE